MFLQWIPWVLRMGRPGEKITRKTIMMQNKMKELDLKERSSKSLLANVLDMDDDFRPSSTLPHSHIHPHHPSHAHPPPGGVNNSAPPGSLGPQGPPGSGSGGFIRVGGGPTGLPPLPPSITGGPGGGSAPAPGSADDLAVGNSTNTAAAAAFPAGIYRELNLILKELRVITDKIRDDEDTAAIENDWKFAAMVLDRLCLITFTMFTIIATIAVLFSAPHIIVT